MAPSIHRDRPWLVPLYVGAVTLLVGLLLVVPGRTFTTVYSQDLFVFLDGAWRVVCGQLPNREFHTPLGLIAYLVPALALAATGNLGLTMPLSVLIFTVFLVPPIVWICRSRLPLWLALLFSTFLIVLVTAPINLGETPRDLSFAVYYNRWGWAALALVFVTLVPRREASGGGDTADAVLIGLLLAVLFHLKMTYFVVGGGYVAAMVVVGRTRRLAFGGLVVAAAVLAVAALALGTTSGYIADIRSAAAVSGVVRKGAFALVTMAAANGRPILALGLVAAIARLRGAGWTEVLAAVYIVVSSIVLANQNYHSTELPPLVAAAIVLALAGRPGAVDAGGAAARAGIVVALATLAYVPLVIGLAALALHAAGAARARPPASLGGVALAALPQNEEETPAKQQLRAQRIAEAGQLLPVESSAADYGVTLEDGVALLRATPALAGPIATFDLANPFNALLRRPPPRGDNSWNHYGRTFSETVHPPADEALRDVGVIMVPKIAIGSMQTLTLMAIDRTYMAQHFHVAAESRFWRAYARSDAR